MPRRARPGLVLPPLAGATAAAQGTPPPPAAASAAPPPPPLPSPRSLFPTHAGKAGGAGGAHAHGAPGDAEPATRPPALSVGAEAPAASSSQAHMLEREMGKLEAQMEQLRSGATIAGGKPVLMAAERARMSKLQRQHQTYLEQRNKIVLRELARKLSDVIASFGERVLRTVGQFPWPGDIRSSLHADPDFAELWAQIAALSDGGRLNVKQDIEATKDELRKIELQQIGMLERELGLAAKQQVLLSQEDQLAEEDEEPEDETALEMERLQHNIERLQQLVPLNSSAAQENPGMSATTLRAALFLKKKMSTLSAQMKEEASTDEGDSASPLARTARDKVEGRLPEKKPTGRGWLEFEEDDARGRDEFVGELFHESEHGLGTMTWVDGTKYKGDFYDGFTHGFGHEIYRDSTSYKGQFSKNLRSGLGVFSSTNGEQFSGEWAQGERHGRGIVSKVSQGKQVSVLAAFEHGDLIEILQDDAYGDDLKDRVQQAVRQAMETAQKAQALASEIRNQTVLEEAGDDVATLKAIGSYGPLHHGPGIEASPENETPVTLVKPHKHLSTWLEAIDLASFADAFREQGFAKPETLLPFLMDKDAFDHFVDAVGLKAAQHRVLWKAIENLDVVITPRNGMHVPKSRELQTVAEEAAEDEQAVAEASAAADAAAAAARDALLMKEKEAARQAEARREEEARLAEQQRQLDEAQKAKWEERAQEQAARELLLTTAAAKEDRDRKFVEKNAKRIEKMQKAVEKEERRLHRERVQKIRSAINRMNNACLLRIFPMWRDIAQELGDARFAEEERLRIEAEAEAARLRAVQLEKERQEAERRRVLEEQERIRRAAEEARIRAEEARLQAIARKREQSAMKLQGAIRRLFPRRLHVSRCGQGGTPRLQALVRRRIPCAVPDVLRQARRVEFQWREENADFDEIVGIQTAVNEDMSMRKKAKRVEIRPANDTNNVLLQAMVAELKEIDRIDALRAEKRRAMSVAHKLELVRRERVKRKLQEQEEKRRRLEEQLERLRKEEEERERERRWHLEELRAQKEAAAREEAARKAAAVAAQLARWREEEERQRQQALVLQQEREAERRREQEREKEIEEARRIEQQRREFVARRKKAQAIAPGLKWMAIGVEKPRLGKEIRNPALAAALRQNVEFTEHELDEFKVGKLSYSSYIKVEDKYFQPAGMTSTTSKSPLGVRFSQDWLQKEPKKSSRIPARPPVGLIPWDARFHVSPKRSNSVMGVGRRVDLAKNSMEHIPERARSEMKGRYRLPAKFQRTDSDTVGAGRPASSKRVPTRARLAWQPLVASSSTQVANAHAKIRARQWQKQEIELPPGMLSVSAWRKMHPAAAVRPRTAVRRLILIQGEIRQQQKKKMEAKKLRAEERRRALEQQQREAADAAAKARETQQLIAAAMQEFEHTLAGILEFEQAQVEAKRAQQTAMSGENGVGHQNWLCAPRTRKKPSLAESIIYR